VTGSAFATHATKAGIRYRYYVSTPLLHGEAKTVRHLPNAECARRTV
jgi:hypothetical protein